MHTITVAITALLLGYHGVSCTTLAPAAIILSEALATTLPPAAIILSEALATVTNSAVPAPTSADPEQFDPNDCSINVMGCANEANNEVIYCGSLDNCVSHCHTIMGDAPDVSGACEANHEAGGTTVVEICTCYDSTHIADIASQALIAVGETACFVWNEGMALTVDALKAIGKIPDFKAAAWAGRIIEVGDKLLAHGEKMGNCDNPFCPGHMFTVVDPEFLEEQLGVLNMC